MLDPAARTDDCSGDHIAPVRGRRCTDDENQFRPAAGKAMQCRFDRNLIMIDREWSGKSAAKSFNAGTNDPFGLN
tara:strand:+ start:343 stop:567 length:225 start_codon:yes stop_codon:yes gene_type:complete